MKRKSLAWAVFLLLGMVSNLWAQHGGHGGGGGGGGSAGHSGHDASLKDFQKAVMLQATDEQRDRFHACMDAAKHAYHVFDQMLGAETSWKFDPSLYPGQYQELRSTTEEMLQSHDQFTRSLSKEQELAMKNQIRKLEQLRGDLDSRLKRIAQELVTAKPDSRRMLTDSRKAREILDKWQDQHKRIGRDIGIEG